MAASAISFLVTNLSTLIQKEVGLLWGVEEDMRKLSSTLSTIMAVLDDAEMKQHQDKSILNWLRKLRDAANKVGDILDECETESLKWEIKLQSSGRLKKVLTSAITCYPVVNLTFRRKIGNRMKDIIEELNGISEERKRFHLNEGFIEKGFAIADGSRETSSSLPPLEVFGRQDDSEKIVKVLTEQVCDLEEVSVYSILGMGGLGKTTLAQMIFNDERINSHFVLKIWVYISQSFDVKMVMSQIIESTTGQTCEASRLESLQKKAKEVLSGKRFLLVLDDAWSEDQDEWDKLKPVLACGLPSSCIVVTTRSEKVASIIRTLPTHYLLPLSEDDCWSLFRQRAFGLDNEARPDLVDIGKEIVKKCGGVPLAAKALGGLMRFKREKKEWVSVKESDIWNLHPQECSILPALILSYYNMSLELRHCFSYCAVFLKGSQIEKDKVIHLWMANGFISSKNNVEVEDVGSQIWNELYMRSLFQDKRKDSRGNIYFKLHDLTHDLAQFVMGDECQMIEAERASSVSTQRTRHATLICGAHHCDFPEALKKQLGLHSILLQSRDNSSYFEFQYSWDLRNLGSLRVFDASGSTMPKFSGSVGNSKHLRYLNLSGSFIRELPASICELLNLQTLNLNDCLALREFPKKMYKLRGLRHLCLLDCDRLEDTPVELGKLKQLKTLSLFVVGEDNGRRLGELHHLDLAGELSIKHLERVKDSIEAKEANLAEKPNLRVVILSWKISSEQAFEQHTVIEALEPHPNIEKLTIEWYGGEELPAWMGNPLILKNIVSIKLLNCKSCVRLPALWKLPCLKSLEISGMEKMEYLMQNSSYITEGGFESLAKLSIVDLPNLIEFPVWMGNPLILKNVVTISLNGCIKCLRLPDFWQLPRLESLFINRMEKLEYMMNENGNNCLATGRGRGEDNVTPHVGGFPSLEILEIANLPNMKGLVVPMDDKEDKQEEGRGQQQQQQELLLPCLKRLFINSCPALTLPLPALPALESLDITDTINVNVLNSISKFTSLASLVLGDNGDLVSLPDEMFQNLTHLETLTISDFRKLETLPRNMSSLVALKKLEIEYCDELKCLPDGGIGSLTSLLKMKIHGCPEMACLPDSIQTLTKLQFLYLSYCSPEFESRCRDESGEDWCKIAHVPNVFLGNIRVITR